MGFSVVTYALCMKNSKSYTDSAVAIDGQLTSMQLDSNNHLIITYTPTGGDPIIFDAGQVPEGKSIDSGSVNSNGELVLTFTDGSTLNVGTVKGDKGEKGDKGDTGARGIPGKEIEIQVDSGYIQYRYVGDTDWINIISTDELKGADGASGEDGKNGQDGQEIQLQMSGSTLQYKYESDTTWIDLYDFSNIEVSASIKPYETGILYKNEDSFYDSVTGNIYTVIQDYPEDHPSVSIANDLANGYIRQIGGGSILISPNIYNNFELTENGYKSNREVITFDHIPTQEEIDLIPEGSEVIYPNDNMVGSFVTEAPNDGKSYVRVVVNNVGSWVETAIPREPERYGYNGTQTYATLYPIRWIDEILILEEDSKVHQLQDNGTDYSNTIADITINAITLTEGMRIKIQYHS